jgi:hypothetical protein
VDWPYSLRERLALDALESEVFAGFRAAYGETTERHARDLGELTQRVLWWQEVARRLSGRVWNEQGVLVSALALCAMEVAREFGVALFLLVHECYRQVGVVVRSALELLVTGCYLDVHVEQRRAWSAAYHVVAKGPSPLQFQALVQALEAPGGVLAGWRLPASFGVETAGRPLFVSVALKRLYGVLTQCVHAKPETLDCVRMPAGVCYQRDRLVSLARLLVDVMAVGALLLQGQAPASP